MTRECLDQELAQIESHAIALAELLDNAAKAPFDGSTLKGILGDYGKLTDGDLDKAARRWMEDHYDNVFSLINAAWALADATAERISSINTTRYFE